MRLQGVDDLLLSGTERGKAKVLLEKFEGVNFDNSSLASAWMDWNHEQQPQAELGYNEDSELDAVMIL